MNTDKFAYNLLFNLTHFHHILPFTKPLSVSCI